MATPPMTPEQKEPLECVSQLYLLCRENQSHFSPNDNAFLMNLVQTPTRDKMTSLIMTRRVNNRLRMSPLQKILAHLVVFDVMVDGHPAVGDDCFSSDAQWILYCSERPKHEERVNAFYLQCLKLGIFVHPSPSP